ncbi:hypothetical protein KR044_003371, partial [Drosophila immigrans]
MGAKVTKMEGTYLPDTPTINKLRISSEIEMSATTPCRGDNKELLDPRSPNGCRTPLNFLQSEPQITQAEPTLSVNENAFTQLRKRLLKGFALNDPRSPQLNRTPLMLDEAIDRTLNMDDTFSDLFVETRVPSPLEGPTIEQQSEAIVPEVHNNSSLEIVSLPYDEEDTMPCDMILQKTPPQMSCDPRSPSVGVERTPIIFCDDEESEARETQMLEEILETLTLNLSNESSMASFASAAEITLDEPQQLPPQPTNKHLERVRLGNKRRVAPRKPARASKSQIYIDSSSCSPKSSTPKSTTKSTPNAGQRTPLGCVNKNRVHLRSRSVEKDLRKTQLPLQCFDDQL